MRKKSIPNKILNDWNNARHAIRGIADTDGSIFTADKPGSPHYPSIEITTTSIELADQLKSILEKNGFNVANIWSNQRDGNRTAYKVALNGRKNLEKWMDQIGFSHPLKRNKAENILSN